MDQKFFKEIRKKFTKVKKGKNWPYFFSCKNSGKWIKLIKNLGFFFYEPKKVYFFWSVGSKSCKWLKLWDIVFYGRLEVSEEVSNISLLYHSPFVPSDVHWSVQSQKYKLFCFFLTREKSTLFWAHKKNSHVSKRFYMKVVISKTCMSANGLFLLSTDGCNY